MHSLTHESTHTFALLIFYVGVICLTVVCFRPKNTKGHAFHVEGEARVDCLGAVGCHK